MIAMQNSYETDSEDEMPSGWQEKSTADGNVYYVNDFLNKIQWVHPVTGKKKVIPKDMPFGWKKTTQENGKVFYVNTETVIVGPVLRHWQVNDYILKNITPTLMPALTALANDRPAEPILWLADQLRRHNPNEPELAPSPAEQREDRRCHTPEPSEVDSFVKII